MIETARRFLMGMALAGILGCPKPTPPIPPTPPTPTPTPTVEGRPASPSYMELLLRSQDGRLLRGGQPFLLSGAIPCWPTDGTNETLIVEGRVIPYWWSLVSPEWMDHIKTKGANAIHTRLGPWDASQACCGNEPIGGAYNADGSWNQAFWDRVHLMLNHAGANGFTAEVDVMDSWLVKHSSWGEFPMPWPPSDVETAMEVPINASVDKWVKKVVYETCNYGNVIFQISNESPLAPHWTPAWEEAMYALIRESEGQSGCNGVVHMIGSNAGVDGPYDYFTSHNPAPALGPMNGRPLMVNEYNNHLSPDQFNSYYCQSRDAGQSFWYWRSDGSDADQDQSLNFMKEQCGSSVGCFAPQSDDPNWEVLGPNGNQYMRDAVQQAEAVVGSRCGATEGGSIHSGANLTIELLSKELRSKGYCAGSGGDAVLIQNPEGLWEEYHAVAYTTGCYTTDPNVNPKMFYKYNGGTNTPTTCPDPLPDREKLEWSLKLSGVWYDATPLVTKDCAYCEAIGMGEINGVPRCGCPARNECPGYQCNSRLACERYLIEAPAPVWHTDGTLEIDPNSLWRARQHGGTYIEVCNGPGTRCTRVN